MLKAQKTVTHSSWLNGLLKNIKYCCCKMAIQEKRSFVGDELVQQHSILMLKSMSQGDKKKMLCICLTVMLLKDQNNNTCFMFSNGLLQDPVFINFSLWKTAVPLAGLFSG